MLCQSDLIYIGLMLWGGCIFFSAAVSTRKHLKNSGGNLSVIELMEIEPTAFFLQSFCLILCTILELYLPLCFSWWYLFAANPMIFRNHLVCLSSCGIPQIIEGIPFSYYCIAQRLLFKLILNFKARLFLQGANDL